MHRHIEPKIKKQLLRLASPPKEPHSIFMSTAIIPFHSRVLKKQNHSIARVATLQP